MMLFSWSHQVHQLQAYTWPEIQEFIEAVPICVRYHGYGL